MKPKSALVILALCATVACSGGSTPAADAPTDAPTGPEIAAVSPPAGAPRDAAAPTKAFPELAYLEQIPYAYRVANDHPEMLAQIPCYCPCELYGHGGVIDCHRSQHSAACATCLEEAATAGRLLEQAGTVDAATYAAVALQVKNMVRSGIIKSQLERNEVANLQTEGGRAYLQACSDCHQPPHPAMYQPAEWRQPLARMEAHMRQRDMEQDPQIWQQAVDFVRTSAAQYPPEAGEDYRARIAEAVETLKAAEGAAAYYPSAQDEVLSPEWFERMVRAYRLARDIPADALAAVDVDDPLCNNLLQCLNSGAAVTSEIAVEEVERLAAEHGLGND
jgi:hypothetical protein